MEAFTTIHRGTAHAVVRRDCADVVAAALVDGAGCEPWRAGGRAAVFRFPCGAGYAVVRHYRRGGLAAHVLPPTRFLANRPKQEFDAHRAAEESGLPVPRLLGVVWRTRGPFFSGGIATEALDAPTLQDALPNAPAPEETLAGVGALVRRMHDAGIVHADLQIRNILISASGPVLLDFDKARVGRVPGRIGRARNVYRLRRSLEKNGFAHPGLFEALLRGYGGFSPPAWLGVLYRLKGRCSDVLPGSERHA